MTRDELAHLLGNGEDAHTEFKRSLCPENDSAVLSTICAFLNADGGVICCGVDEDDAGYEIIGLGNAFGRDAVFRLERRIADEITPGAPIFCHVQEFDSKIVLTIQVPPGSNPPYAYKNMVYVRRGAANLPAAMHEIREMVLRTQDSKERWENRFAVTTIDECIDQLEVGRFAKFLQEKGVSGQDELKSAADVLSAVQSYRYGRLLNAGVVVAARKPADYIPQARVRVACFDSSRTDNAYAADIYNGPLGTVIDRVTDFVLSHAPKTYRFNKDLNRRETVSAYPRMLIREAVVNACAHRDYASAFGGVSVQMYPDRIEVWNSGGLPPEIDIDDLNAGRPQRSILKNPTIAYALHICEYMEQHGRGSVLIPQECEKNGLKPPEWSLVNGGVLLTLRLGDGGNGKYVYTRSAADDTINEAINDTIKSIVSEHPGVKAGQLSVRLGKSRSTISRALNGLVKSGVVRYAGSKKTGGYYLLDMSEVNFDYKCIVAACFAAEHAASEANGGVYCPEKKRQLMRKLEDAGLIRYEPAKDSESLNHFVFLGFTDKGRDLFVKDGMLRSEYAM